MFSDKDSGKIADRMVRLIAAFAMLNGSSLETLATEVEISKLVVGGAEDGTSPDPEAVRRTMLWLLDEYARNLREQLD